MTHEQLFFWVSGVHVGAALTSFVVLFKCGSWSNRFRTWLEDIDGELASLRREVAFELAEVLKPVFENANNVLSDIILNLEGAYCERPINPAGSEGYRNAINEYVENGIYKMAKWRSLHLVRQAGMSCAAYLTWSITAIIAVELLVVASIMVTEKLIKYPLSENLIWATLIITGIITANALFAWMFSLFYHNRGLKRLN